MAGFGTSRSFTVGSEGASKRATLPDFPESTKVPTTGALSRRLSGAPVNWLA
jgi:hypothetical protein